MDTKGTAKANAAESGQNYGSPTVNDKTNLPLSSIHTKTVTENFATAMDKQSLAGQTVVGSDAPKVATSLASDQTKKVLKEAREAAMKASDERPLEPSSARQRRAREVVRLSYAVDPSHSVTETNFANKKRST